MSYLGTIGLEIHAQLRTASKLFCSCPAAFSDQPNTHVCNICLGFPGALPSLNGQALRQALKVASALGMAIPAEIRFDRKHYFYPDLAKSYQVSQFYSTLGRNGSSSVEVRGRVIPVRIREVHLEEDAGKLLHAGEESMVDFNRAGVPLLELVTEPDFHIGEEAETFFRYYQLLLRTIDSSEANMELGQMRCDANVSVSRQRNQLGTRVEIKNISSPRFIRLAIDYEIQRQIGILEAGGTIQHETRRWNENRGRTESMRSKELALDYRYLQEPDLAVVRITPAELKKIGSLPELPDPRRSL
ncbi:MAG: Asp-tRNA(Asn)/Glu-tRNA(Gln) amidotransferase subunit GatB, partial [Candidatus Wallbacteria bacterium]|nr:Asp-tRNA(Asn)/Glu-tRNA(Gln) amidotransferase subunit GatB [Candidatus Wallbacteria bacterium]